VNTTAILIIAAGILIRFGLPIALMAMMIYLLRKLDAHWQAEAQAQKPMPGPVPCWEEKHCSPETISACDAAAHPDVPCWQTFRQGNGYLREICLGCAVFRNAPVPSPR
jgi:hypothetical protein